RRAREEKVPELIVAALQKLIREIRSSQSAFRAGVEAQLDTEILRGANDELFRALQLDLDSFTRHLAAGVESIENQARVAEDRIRTHATLLAERHAIQDAEYRTVIAASEEQGERAAQRLALQNALANAQSAANEQSAKEQQRLGILNVRAGRLNRTSELRDQRFALRKQVAERLSTQFP